MFEKIAAAALAAGLLFGCGSLVESKGAECCSCLVDNGCWDSRLCPRASDCNYFYDEDYGGSTPSDPCQSWTVSCQQEHCAVCAEVHSNFR